MALLPTGLFAALASKAPGFGFGDAVARGWLGGVAAVLGESVFELLDTGVQGVDVVQEALDQGESGFEATFVNGLKLFAFHSAQKTYTRKRRG
jgi:hypothetical protein